MTVKRTQMHTPFELRLPARHKYSITSQAALPNYRKSMTVKSHTKYMFGNFTGHPRLFSDRLNY